MLCTGRKVDGLQEPIGPPANPGKETVEQAAKENLRLLKGNSLAIALKQSCVVHFESEYQGVDEQPNKASLLRGSEPSLATTMQVTFARRYQERFAT